MNRDRLLLLACVASIFAACGDFLMLFVGNSLRPSVRPQQTSMIILAVGGSLGCLFIPLFAFGYAALARVVRRSARVTASIILFGGIALGIVGSFIHGVTWKTIRSAMSTGGGDASSSSPMEAVVRHGGLLLNLWIIGSVLLLILTLFIVRSGLLRPHPIPLWLAVLNPLTLTVLIGVMSAFSAIGRSYILPMAPNLAHLGFFLACLWSLRSDKTAVAGLS